MLSGCVAVGKVRLTSIDLWRSNTLVVLQGDESDFTALYSSCIATTQYVLRLIFLFSCGGL